LTCASNLEALGTDRASPRDRHLPDVRARPSLAMSCTSRCGTHAAETKQRQMHMIMYFTAVTGRLMFGPCAENGRSKTPFPVKRFRAITARCLHNWQPSCAQKLAGIPYDRQLCQAVDGKQRASAEKLKTTRCVLGFNPG
jgi:hypothetical protein